MPLLKIKKLYIYIYIYYLREEILSFKTENFDVNDLKDLKTLKTYLIIKDIVTNHKIIFY